MQEDLVLIFSYRAPINNKKYIFFSEISNSLNRAAMKYYNLLVISDLNIDNLNKKKDNIEILKTFTKMIDLVNLI